MPLELDEKLKDGFWSMTRVAPSFEDEFIEVIDVDKEYDEDEHYVGHT